MGTLVVTRHKGAIEWLKCKGHIREGDTILEEFKPEMVSEGDTVIGVLPLALAVQALERGARVYLLQLPQVPRELRGKELSVEEMDEYGTALCRFGLVRYCLGHSPDGEWIEGTRGYPCSQCADYSYIALSLEEV